MLPSFLQTSDSIAMMKRAGESAAIFFLVLTSFAATNVAPTKPELEAMYNSAAEDVSSGHYREALAKIDAIDQRQPDLAAAQNLRGVALMRLGEYRNAETALRKARVLDPGFWEARFNLAEVPFLAGNWTEARNRFRDMTEQPNEHVQGATLDLINFKIYLTLLLEGKDKEAAPVLEKLQASVESPALYYTKAALALKRKERTQAKSWMATAEKEYSEQLNKLFAESFYEIGWLPKPKDAAPVALEVSSEAERIEQAQANLARAERAFRQGDLDGAWQLLDKVDAITPNQAAAFNLRGEILLEQGKIDEAEAALRNALTADPQLLSARYNLARVRFARKDYGTARKELEELQGAFAGTKEQRKTELMRYEVFLTLLLEGHEGAAQKAMDEFKMMDDSPALYYAQAAWAFQHGNSRQAKNWLANAANLYPADLNRAFAAPLADVGWVPNPIATASPTPGPVLVQNAMPAQEDSSTQGPSPRKEEAPTREAAPRQETIPKEEPTPTIAAPPKIEPTPAPTATPEKPASRPSPSPTEVAKSKATPAPEPEVSPTPEEVAPLEKKQAARESSDNAEQPSRKRPRKSDDEQPTTPRPKPSPSPAPSDTPIPIRRAIPVVPPNRENLGDKVRNFFLYPFKRPIITPTPAPTPTSIRPAAKATPTASPRQR